MQDVSSFFQLFEALCSEEYCGFMLKKPDRKKERYTDVFGVSPCVVWWKSNLAVPSPIAKV